MIPREQVARELAVSVELLERLESRGLVKATHHDGAEGYGPKEVRRLWTIVTFQRDLGINLAGIEAILKLRDHMADVHLRLSRLADELRRAIDDVERSRDDG
jgi:MerR family transcriptional regulator/heat shock protein HspR